MSKYPDSMIRDMSVMWNDGMTTRDIGANFGMNKNQIVGIVHRNREHFPARAKRPYTPRPRRAKPTVKKIRPVSPEPETIPEPEPIEVRPGERLGILNLSSKTCRWPIGHPGKPDFHFCGHRPKAGTPYCAYHASRAYQPIERVR